MNNNQSQNQSVVEAMQLLTAVIIPIIVATAIIGPIIFGLGKGMLWGKKEED